MRVLLVGTLVAAFCLSHAYAHICMVDPPQRGGYNISTPGNMKCFQPNPPCGSIPATGPVATLPGGSVYHILAQQNLNHWNVGWPGFVDVAWAMYPEPSKDEDFHVVRSVPDYWAHLQAQQTNYSIPVVLPNINCDHCVLRVRYHPNKPTEPIFHQCADISIRATDSTYLELGGLLGNVGPNPATAKLYATTIAHFDGSGEPTNSVMDIPTKYYSPEGLATYDSATDTAYYIGCAAPCSGYDGSTPTPPNTLISFAGTTSSSVEIHLADGSRPEGVQWDAIISTGNPDAPLGLIGRVGNSSNFFFYQYRTLTTDGVVSEPLAQSTGQQTFVNFMWASNVDVKANKMYFAAGDENSLYKLNLVVFTVDLTAKTMTGVMQDNTRYTLSSIHLNPADGKLYTVSPGLFMSDHQYSLVTVDPTTGDVDPVGIVAAPGTFKFSYAGGVYGHPVLPEGFLVYMFERSLDGAPVLAYIDLASGAIKYEPSIDLGVNSIEQLKTPVYIPASSTNFRP